jgi:hypothetical protein
MEIAEPELRQETMADISISVGEVDGRPVLSLRWFALLPRPPRLGSRPLID